MEPSPSGARGIQPRTMPRLRHTALLGFLSFSALACSASPKPSPTGSTCPQGSTLTSAAVPSYHATLLLLVDPMPPTEKPEFALGLRLHNEGEYYEAHEAWESIWINESNDEWRLFVQGLIQVTSAFHKLFGQRAPGGAARLLARGLEKLDKYPPDYLGVALGSFRDGARPFVDTMSALAANDPGIDRLDRSLVPRLGRTD